ncbi:MAG: copper resistance protein CopC [Vicinamibacterales bacterium]
MSFRTIARAAVSAVVVLALSTLAQAHTKLEKSDPADGATLTTSPKWVQLFFNEKPDLKVSKVELTGPSGKIELGAAHSMADKDIMSTIDRALDSGKYTVSWQTAGKDGHVIKGSFSFTVSRAQ